MLMERFSHCLVGLRTARATGAALLVVGVWVGTGCAARESLTGPAAPTAEDRTAGVYVEMLRTFLTDRGSYPKPNVITVDTTAEDRAGWAGKGSELITPGVRESVAAQLDGVVEVRWVEKLDVPMEIEGPPEQWYVTLSPVPDEGDRLEISVSAAVGADLGWLNTYVLEADHESWAVTGTTAPAGVT